MKILTVKILENFRKRLSAIEVNRYKEIVLVVALLLLAAVSHGYNMFNFPYYENDEGVYLSQSWSFLKFGQLAPYTYWYDHAPAGWIFMGLWIKLTGGFFTFGTAINSGRVFMLILHVAASGLLFYIAKKLTGRLFPGILAIIIFSLSPLAIYFQRRVLLDNIMIFWILASFALLLTEKLKLSSILLSAAAFGIAVLTKETAIFFLPAFLYTIHSRRLADNKVSTFVQWLTVVGSVTSVYFLYALLRGEFFPAGFLGSQKEHVSLISSLVFLFGRGSRLPFWNPESDFYVNLQEWISKDPFTVILGAAATVISLSLMIKVKELRIPALLAVVFWIFLMRSNLIIDFYVLPAIPLLSLNLGVLSEFLIHQFSQKIQNFLRLSVLAVIILGIFFLAPLNPYVRNETKPQLEAIKWIKENLSENTYFIIDNYAFIDLHQPKSPGDKVFSNADWFWKLDYDPAVRDQKYGEDWHKIEYIILSHEMVRQMKFGTQKMLLKAFDNSHLIIDWREGSTAYLDLRNFISTNGDWIAIFKTNDKYDVALRQSWNYFKKKFIINYGQVIDPANNDITTSEGQAYTMLRAVWENDQGTFKGVWQWSKDHLQYRNQDKLLSWSWVKENNEYKLADWASASDADEDIALALLFAGKRWKNETYTREAKEMISDIWRQEVKQINGSYYLISGSDKKEREGYLVNPSYFSPATYKIFAQVDKDHPWNRLADDSYRFLNRLGQNSQGTYLPPNWVLVDEKGGLHSAAKYVPKDPDYFGYDAFRVMWRVGLDQLWFNDSRAAAYLKKVEPFYLREWKNKGKIAALYSTAGEEKVSYDNLSTNVGALSVFSFTNRNLAKELYDKRFDQQFNYNEGYWNNAKDYYDQSWGWFGDALYSRDLPNYWSNWF